MPDGPVPEQRSLHKYAQHRLRCYWTPHNRERRSRAYQRPPGSRLHPPGARLLGRSGRGYRLYRPRWRTKLVRKGHALRRLRHRSAHLLLLCLALTLCTRGCRTSKALRAPIPGGPCAFPATHASLRNGALRSSKDTLEVTLSSTRPRLRRWRTLRVPPERGDTAEDRESVV